ncbi:MAG TPA: hypothetical protein VGS19_00135 [Streptosporangiaceae bacterium]|nr:hypothetical protein [Streptosporangiaceae bacterium]
MTSVLPNTRQGEQPDEAALAMPSTRPKRRPNWFQREPAWPLVSLLVYWPLWWASGIGDYAPVVVAIPMARKLYLWNTRGERKIKAPPGFGLWLLFLVIMMAGCIVLTQTAPNTMPGTASTRSITWLSRALSYLSYTVILLFAGNLTEKEYPRRKLAWHLGIVGAYAVIFGYLALADPTFTFTAPITPLIPQSIQQASQGQVYAMLHPSMTQLEAFNGQGRVTAPFLYANTWGNNIAITLPWLFVIWKDFKKRWQRRTVFWIMIGSIIPMVYSFDRGLWVAIIVGILYIAIRFALMGKTALLGFIVAGTVLGGVVYFVTPIHTIVSTRVQNGYSNTARGNESLLALQGGIDSPVIGFGDTRREFGSVKSISVGRTSKCTACGQRSAGSNGQIWLLLISTGLVGTFFFMGFFIYGCVRYWRDRSPIGLVGVLVLLLGFVFGAVYDSVGATLAFTFLAYALLWRNEKDQREEQQGSGIPPVLPEERVRSERLAITAGPSA